jgi:hypothetical protein
LELRVALAVVLVVMTPQDKLALVALEQLIKVMQVVMETPHYLTTEVVVVVGLVLSVKLAHQQFQEMVEAESVLP